MLPGRKRTLTFKGKNKSSWSVMGAGAGASKQTLAVKVCPPLSTVLNGQTKTVQTKLATTQSKITPLNF